MAVSFLVTIETLVMGCLLLFGGPQVFTAGPFDTIKAIAPQLAWGAIFLTVGVVNAVLLFTAPRKVMVNTAIVIAAIHACWGVAFATYAINHHGSGAVGATIWCAYAAFCYMKMLALQEP